MGQGVVTDSDVERAGDRRKVVRLLRPEQDADWRSLLGAKGNERVQARGCSINRASRS